MLSGCVRAEGCVDCFTGWAWAARALLRRRLLRVDSEIFVRQVLQNILCHSRADGLIGRLNLRRDFRHFSGKLAAERRTVELQQSLDLVIREMFVVDADQLPGHFVRH